MSLRRTIFAAIAAAFISSPALAGSSPGWTYKYVPTAAEWNAAFASKQDDLGYVPLNIAGGTMSGRLITAAPGATTSGLNLTPGSAPGSPVDGDVWVSTGTGGGLFLRVNGATVGPFIGASGTNFAATSPVTVSAVAGLVTYACPTCGIVGSPLSQFASTTSAQLAGVLSDETGTGLAVFSNSPSLTTPNLGTPSAAVLTNATGLPVGTGISGLATGMATFLATPSSANLIATVTDETGSGSLVFGTSPTLTTPTIGVATATSINKVAITAPVTSATLTIANGKTLTDTSAIGASILLGSTGGGFAAYGGGTCTNQAVTALSAAGAPTCTSITNSFLTAGTFGSITGTGTLTAGATGSGFTVALGTSTITGILPAANLTALTGDVTNTAGTAATTISANAVSNAKLATMGANTFKANVTAGTATPTDATLPNCNGANQALIYTNGTGLGCATISGGGGTVAAVAQPQGRCTLTSGVAVTTSSVASATTLYYTPSSGRYVPIWNGTAWINTDIGGELSQTTTDTTKSPAAAAANQVYDIYVWNDAGTIRATRGPPWSAGTGGSNTVRGTGAGSTQLLNNQGLLVNQNAITNGPAAGVGTYVCTVMTDGSSQLNMTFGSAAAGGGFALLGVWNAYNRVAISATVQDTTTSWTYSGNTPHAANASANNAVVFVTGLAVDAIEADYAVSCTLPSVASSYSIWGYGMDTTTAFDHTSGAGNPAAASMFSWSPAVGTYKPVLGKHVITALELADGVHAVTFNGVGTGQGKPGLGVSLPM